MENTANQPNTAAEKPEEKAGTQNDTAENPSEVRTDSAFDEESEGSRASENRRIPTKPPREQAQAAPTMPMTTLLISIPTTARTFLPNVRQT